MAELAHEIGSEVLEVTVSWRDYMIAAGVGESDLALLERCFALREVVARWHDKAGANAGDQALADSRDR